MAAAPTNLLLAQNFTAADLNSLGRANSPALTGGQPPGAGAQNGLQFQTREEAQMFLQTAARAQQQNGTNSAGGIALTRDAVAALQHAAQVATVNQAKMGPHGNGTGANGAIRPPVSAGPPLSLGQNQALANLQTQAHLQAAMNAQRAAAQAAAAQQSNGLSAANNQAALFLVQNQLAQAQAAGNAGNPFGLQNGLQNNPIAAAAAAAAAVAASTQAAQARAAAVGNANLLQLQQAAQAAGLQRPQAMAWAQNQALQNAAIAQHNLAQHNLAQQNLAAAQNNPALLAAALQAQQARAALQVQQLAAQQQAAAAAARPLAPAQQGNVAAAAQQQLQVLRQLQARLNAAQAPNALAAVAAAAPAAAAKPTEAQLQALRTALARSAAGRAALNAANVLGANTPRNAVPPANNGAGAPPALNPLQQAINIQLLLQQQRNAVQVQQAQAQVTAAMANNIAANIQNNAAAAALNGQLAALQQAAAASAVANGQRPVLQGNTAAALAGMSGVGGPNAGVLNDAMLQNLQKMQLAKAMQDSAAAASVTGLSMPAADKGSQGGDAAAAAATNSSKEQRRLALACVALQLARGGMTVEQAINSGIMGGMSVTDVKFIVECYNAERQRMQSEGAPGGGAAPAAANGGAIRAGPQQPGAPPPHGGVPQQGLPPGLPGGHIGAAGGLHGIPGHLQGPVDLGVHGGTMNGMGAPHGMVGHHHGMSPNGMPPQPPLPFGHSPSAPGSPAVGGDLKDAAALAATAGGSASRLGPIPIPGHSSAPVSPPRTASQGSPTNTRTRLTGAGSDVDGGAHETRSEGGASAELAADAAAAVAALAKEPFDAFSYAFFGATEGPGMGELLGELETGGAADGELESGAVAPLDAEAHPGEHGRIVGASPLNGLGELAPDQAAWLRAAASANQAMWAGEGAEDGPMNDEIAARLANLDLGSGFF
ncbi:hypothetical protein PLESTB_001530100 [Pleodorina starrii]|uniref:Uncharacterized protein n=1 Tax=Pleodorina starrii TaxID=330485 RepID=A0A9W6BWE1_9CHLO|nr:hypothetical protein PLESTM_001163500 [Pleodorina starrii]GLC59756.1 hypothetical protein PLESTB_001530100 [Pleodorina starrii]GLC75321.1 hypothetical protein PLESTF_001623700 [Pleodorina starrii]